MGKGLVKLDYLPINQSMVKNDPNCSFIGYKQQ